MKAYKQERRQEWIGCWILDDCIQRISDLTGELERKNIVQYPIPLKDGEIKHFYAFNWVKSLGFEIGFKKIDDIINHVNERLKFIREARPADWDVKRKYDNTNKFLDYILSSEFVEIYKKEWSPYLSRAE